MKLSTYLDLVSRLRFSAAKPPFFLCSFMTWIGTNLPHVTLCDNLRSPVPHMPTALLSIQLNFQVYVLCGSLTVAKSISTGKFVPVLSHAPCHEGVWGSRCRVPRILNVDTGWRRNFSRYSLDWGLFGTDTSEIRNVVQSRLSELEPRKFG